jgi:glycosyltransferase involved in cell wall biosynthesis
VKLAVIIQRYGPEVLGGSEHLCRLLAERLAAQHEVEVLTTCARDYQTWKNEYPEGVDRVRGVTVRRFANAKTRDIEAFNRYSEWIYRNAHSAADERSWLEQQGPWCPNLIDYLRRHQQEYDALVFFTYLYAPTVLGLEVNPGKSVLVSTAHDEPAITLQMYKEVFGRPAAICYLTESERQFVLSRFAERPLLEDVIGVGVEIPPQQPHPRAGEPGRAGAAGGEAGGSGEAGVPGAPGEGANSPEAADGGEDEAVAREYPSHLFSRGSMFRRRHRLHGPVVLYGGRIDPGKGCEELIEYFSAYVKEGGEATLALMGVKMMALPEEPFIRFAGMLPDAERLQAMEAATVVVCPSPYESLSLLALESLSVGTPILANARSAVLVEHCVKSNGGLYYANRDEFIECLKLLVADPRLRAALGRNGRDYVRRNYRWDVVLGKYDRIFAKVRSAR